MKLLLVKILLAPLLLIQSLWVRHKTPQLPEPVTDNQGQVGSGPELNLLLLGDSSAAGVGAESAQDSLLGQLIILLSEKYTLSFQMLAATGKTTADTLVDIQALKQQKFDVIITALGVNDVTSQISNQVWRQQQLDLINLLQQQFSPQQIIMSGLPPVRDFPALPWPLNLYLGLRADQLNDTLHELLTSQPQVTFHGLRGYPSEAKTATDGFHPGPKVYQLWAENLVAMINQ